MNIVNYVVKLLRLLALIVGFFLAFGLYRFICNPYTFIHCH